MNSDRSRGLVARVRRRMLLAIGAGVAPLPRATASARLPVLAERFAAGDKLDDAEGAAFFAALNAYPDLAEAFVLVAEATAATGAALPSLALSRRLAALSGAADLAPSVPSGRAVAVAQALAAWRAGGAAALAVALGGSAPPSAPAVATADTGAYAVLRETGARYDLGPGGGASHLPLAVVGRTGAFVRVNVGIEVHEAGYLLRVSLRDAANEEPPAQPWWVAARLGRRGIPGAEVAPGEWVLGRALTEAEFARVTVVVREG